MQFEEERKHVKKNELVLKISADTTELDDAIKKANQLKAILAEALGVTPNDLYGIPTKKKAV